MKQYVIDELRPADHDKVKAYLDDHYAVPGFEGLYHLPLVEDHLTGMQLAHAQCRPHYVALELHADRLVCELLVRTGQRIQCECMRYMTEKQRNWLVQTVENVLRYLEITI